MNTDPNKRTRIFKDDDRLHHEDESEGLSQGWYRHHDEPLESESEEKDSEDERDRIGS